MLPLPVVKRPRRRQAGNCSLPIDRGARRGAARSLTGKALIAPSDICGASNGGVLENRLKSGAAEMGSGQAATKVIDDETAAAAGGLCFDTSALIALVDAGILGDVGTWLSEGAYRAAAVNDELAASLEKYPQNKQALEAAWLVTRAAPIETEEYRQLHLLFGARRGKGAGEAETLTLCQLHEWTAVINDKGPRNTARLLDRPVNAVCTTELLIVAVAQERIALDEGWEAFQEVHRRYEPKSLSGLGTDSRFHTVFRSLIEHVSATMPAVGLAAALGTVGRVDETVRQIANAVGVS